MTVALRCFSSSEGWKMTSMIQKGMREMSWRPLRQRLPRQSSQLEAGSSSPPPSKPTRYPDLPGAQDLPLLASRPGEGRLRFRGRLALEPRAPTPGSSAGPHPSCSFSGNSPGARSEPQPQFRRRERRVTGGPPAAPLAGGRGHGPEVTQSHVCDRGAGGAEAAGAGAGSLCARRRERSAAVR